MKNDSLADLLRIAKPLFIAIHAREAKALRRKPFPHELVGATKAWAEKLLDVITVCPGPGKPRSAMADAKSGPQIYAEQIRIAQAILDICDALTEPVRIMAKLHSEFPQDFADIKTLPQYVRVVRGNGRRYFFYRREAEADHKFEQRLPDASDDGFMQAYRKAEAAYNARCLHSSYHRHQVDPQLLAA